jgi:hypothetical protein
MLSFELSVIDIVLVIAIITLLLLYITKPSAKAAAGLKLSPEQKETSKESDANVAMSESSSTPPLEYSVRCPHHFGYLKTLPLGSSVPEECYSCSRMMQCLFQANGK